MKLYTEITIQATPEQIYACIVNFANYASWNPFITAISGEPIVGTQLKVQIDTMKFTPIVIEATHGQKLTWQGKLWIKGLFDGQHTFEIIDNKDGSCLFVHQETFKGILLPLLSKKIRTSTQSGFKAMNLALKRHLEQ